MRIISKFHDYYDSVQRQGMDKDVVYVREKKISLIKDTSRVADRGVPHVGTVHLRYLGFCGQIYRVYIVKATGITYITYDFEDFKEVSMRFGLTAKYDFGRSKWWPGRFQEFRDENTDYLLELFHQHQVPIFLIEPSEIRHKNTLILNPNLKDLDFQTVKDTYTTYQDIYQYVAGVLNSPENKMVKISDKDKISKHGFDKHSFRKLPTKKGKA